MKYSSEENAMEMTINLHVSHFNNTENGTKKEFSTLSFKNLLFTRCFNICLYITSMSSCTLWASSEIIQMSCYIPIARSLDFVRF